MHKEVEKYLRVKRKLIVLEYARVFGSNLEAYEALKCALENTDFVRQGVKYYNLLGHDKFKEKEGLDQKLLLPNFVRG